jgi:hypothetical protein
MPLCTGISGGVMVAIALWRLSQANKVRQNLGMHSAVLTLAILAVVGYSVLDFHKDKPNIKWTAGRYPARHKSDGNNEKQVVHSPSIRNKTGGGRNVDENKAHGTIMAETCMNMNFFKPASYSCPLNLPMPLYNHASYQSQTSRKKLKR